MGLPTAVFHSSSHGRLTSEVAMDASGLDGLDRVARRRLYRRAVVRPLLTVTALIALYYVLPLNNVEDPQLALILGAGMLAIVALCVWQVRAIQRARYPALQAIEGLAAAVPLFLLLFAAGYFVLASATPGAFTQPVGRTDALYFTVTVFATVGFGDIAPVTQPARVAVLVQMVADLLVLGVLLRTVTGAVRVRRARQHQSTTD
jgi:voltage-gated potassium channel